MPKVTETDANIASVVREVLRTQNTIAEVVIACLQMQIAYYAASSGRKEAADKAMELAEKRFDSVQVNLETSRRDLVKLLETLGYPTDG